MPKEHKVKSIEKHVEKVKKEVEKESKKIEKVEKESKKIEKVEKESKKIEKEPEEFSESEVTICSWYTYNHTRCNKKTDNSKFCDRHNRIIKNDLQLVSSEESDNNACNTMHEVKMIPRSLVHLKRFMKNINYDSTTVDVCFPGGLEEEGALENDEYILMPDDTKIYYHPIKIDKVQQLTVKKIKIKFFNNCNNDPVIKIDDEYYCKECYVKLSKKIGYPKLSVLKI